MEPSDEGQCDAQGEKVCESEQDQVASNKQRCRKHDRHEGPEGPLIPYRSRPKISEDVLDCMSGV